jgi:D-proline reductase (dithiol) PrdB
VGLIQRVIEAAGIPTISVTLSQGISRKVKPPRTVYTGFPLGHPFAFPHQRFRQLQLLRLLLGYLQTLDQPGRIVVHKLSRDEDPEQHCVLCDGL